MLSVLYKVKMLSKSNLKLLKIFIHLNLKILINFHSLLRCHLLPSRTSLLYASASISKRLLASLYFYSQCTSHGKKLLSLDIHHVLSRCTTAFLEVCCAAPIVRFTMLAPFGHKLIKVCFVHPLSTFYLLLISLSK